jgi:hypothetical protein
MTLQPHIWTPRYCFYWPGYGHEYSRGRKRIYPSAVLRAACISRTRRMYFWRLRVTVERGNVGWWLCIWCVWFPTLHCGFVSWSVRKGQRLDLVVSVIHIVLPPFITQSVHYKTISTIYVVEPKILHCSDIHKADILGRDWYTSWLRNANHTSPKQHREKVDFLSVEDYEPTLLFCVPEDFAYHGMVVEFKTRCCDQLCRSIGGLWAQRRVFDPRTVSVGWICD